MRREQHRHRQANHKRPTSKRKNDPEKNGVERGRTNDAVPRTIDPIFSVFLTSLVVVVARALRNVIYAHRRPLCSCQSTWFYFAKLS